MELRGAEAYIERHGRARKRHRWLTGMAAVVVFCTTYALMLPAVTLEQKTLVCGQEEHVHTESCCDLFSESNSDSLSNGMSDGICDKEEHVHDEKCYIKEPENDDTTDGAPEPQADTASAVSMSLRAAARSVDTASTLPVLEVEAVNTWDPNAEVILVYPQKFNMTGSAISTENSIDLEACFGTEADPGNYYALRIEKRDGRYQVVWAGAASGDTCVTCQDAYLLLLQKAAYPDLLDLVKADADGNGDSAHFNLLCGNTEVKTAADGSVYGYVTVFHKEYDEIPGTGGSMGPKDDDVAVVAGDPAIRFQLFNYNGDINYTEPYQTDGTNQQRDLTPYFVFKGTYTGGHAVNQNSTYDADGFPKNHATVERTLDKDGYPVLDINRAADGETKGNPVDLSQEQRSLNYLFGGVKDHAVTAYTAENTLLQKTDGHYYYASVNNAVDYDTENNLFRVRNYTERNSMTAKYGAYWDFMPFNYTDGVVNGTINGTSYTGAGKNGLTYNLREDQVDYWFGMRMDVDFFQPYDGKLGEEAMKFTFAGDDDVWVFVDDVLVLDLGGTHGEVTGTIDFATGEITQQLTWLGVETPSWPTTLKECFEAAEREPSGGWKGETFADYSKHTLSFFYLERGASVANCKIDFNLYTLPDKELSVAKLLRSDASADKGTMDYLADTMEYRFQVLKADSGGKATENLLAGKGTKYTLIAPGKAEQTMAVGDDGWFTLRSGQRAVFSNTMAMFAETEVPKQYVVRELIPTAQGGQYKDVVYTLDATDGAATQDYQTSKETTTDFQGYDSGVLDAAKGNLVVFYNTVSTEVMGTLKVTKDVGGIEPLTGETYWFRILAGPSATDLTALPAKTAYTVTTEADSAGTTKTTDTNGLFELKEGETLSLRLLTGTYYQVVEVHADGTALTQATDVYQVTYTNQTGQFDTGGKIIEVTATNTYEDGSLSLTKRVNNTYDSTETGGAFAFQLAIQNLPTGWAGRTFPVTYTTTVSGGQTHTNGNVNFDASGKATLELYHGETAKIDQLPLNMSVQVTERNTAGYSVSWEIGTTTVSGTAQQTVSLGKTTPYVALTCVNTTGYELPSTGGPGTGLFYGFGGALTLGALALLSMKRHGGRRRDAF